MECQETLEHMVVEYETIVDEDGYEEEEEEELYDCENGFEPADLADLVLHCVEYRPEVFPFNSLIVNGEPTHLDCLKISINRSRVDFKLLGKFSCRFPPFGRN